MKQKINGIMYDTEAARKITDLSARGITLDFYTVGSTLRDILRRAQNEN